MTDERLTIGELAKDTGVATSALRYWEELGLLPSPGRVSGHRRYPRSAARQVGMILLLRDVGFTLREIKTFMAPGAAGRRELHERKLAELDRRIAQARTARTAIAHALACPYEDIEDCPTHTAVVEARLSGIPLEEAHADHCRRPGTSGRPGRSVAEAG